MFLNYVSLYTHTSSDGEKSVYICLDNDNTIFFELTEEEYDRMIKKFVREKEWREGSLNIDLTRLTEGSKIADNLLNKCLTDEVLIESMKDLCEFRNFLLNETKIEKLSYIEDELKLKMYKLKSMAKYAEDNLKRKTGIRNKVSEVLENYNWV